METKVANKRNTDSSSRPGPAGETHGILPNTRSESRDNSAAMISALPHPPPDYKPTESMRYPVIPVLPEGVTTTTLLDHTLPHMTNSQIMRKRMQVIKQNKLVLQAHAPVPFPAQNMSTMHDNRHEVIHKGGATGVFTAHGGELKPGDNQSGEMEGGAFKPWNPIAHQERAHQMIKDTQARGGKVSLGRVGADIGTFGVAEGFRAGDKAIQKKQDKQQRHADIASHNINQANAVLRQAAAIPDSFKAQGGKSFLGIKTTPHNSDNIAKNVFSLGIHSEVQKNRQQQHAIHAAQQNDRDKSAAANAVAPTVASWNALSAKQQNQYKQKSKVPKPTAPSNNTPIAPNVNVKQTEMVGGKSKFWRGLALNLSGLANNVSRAFAENGDGGEIKMPAKKKTKNKILKGGKSVWGQVTNNLVHTAVNIAKFEAENPELIAVELAPLGV